VPKGAPGSQRPNPSLEWRISILRQVLKYLLGVAQFGLENYHKIVFLTNQRDEQNLQKQKLRNGAKTKLF